MAGTNISKGARLHPNQGLVHHTKEPFKPLSFDLFTGIAIICVGMLMIIGRVISHEVIFDMMACVLLALTWMEGNNFHQLVSYPRLQTTLQVVISVLGLFMIISGVQSVIDQDEDLQSCPFADSDIWEIIHRYVTMLSAPLLALLVGLLIFGNAVNQRRTRLINEEQDLDETPAPEAEPADDLPDSLPIYPFVEGTDLEDVMNLAPVAKGGNSLLKWLPKVEED